MGVVGQVVSGHRAEEMGLRLAVGMLEGAGLEEGGWDFTCVSCTPKINPSRRLWEFPIIFTINVLFIKLSHCKPLFHSHTACGDSLGQEIRSTPRNTASPRPGGMPWAGLVCLSEAS